MAKDKSGKSGGHRNHTSVSEHVRTLSAEKFAKRPPSLNEIDKQQQ
ncbi:hypothetical protein KP806_23295 [Paenibacillus sp. N4]|nr:hypothetical protein [Paenibacillus vietnamensis]MCA0757990.1 hypothetical protein [Paenibacillus vietnamensis]